MSDDKIFRNHYYCDECDVYWDDDWSCQVDDRCPRCDTSISPFHSEDIPPLHVMYGCGLHIDRVWIDEADRLQTTYIPLRKFYKTDEEFSKDPSHFKDNYMNQPIPVKGVETPPSEAKRAKLRAKRRKR